MPPSLDSPYRLLVEGPDDSHSIIHLLSRHEFDWNDKHLPRPYLSESGGVTELLEAFPLVLKGPYQRVGVVLDANASLSARWAQLRSRAQHGGVELPVVPDPEGTIVPGRLPEYRVGIWIMPDNTSPGTLENFLQELALADPLWSYADETAREARSRGGRCAEKDHLKSALHTFLAWQEDPGIPFGVALRAKVFAHDSDNALRFVSWFRRLFSES